MTDYIEAHKFSSNNKEALQNDKKCGCFYCLKIFDPKEINFWIKDKACEQYIKQDSSNGKVV